MQLDTLLSERKAASMCYLDTKTLSSLFLLPENIAVEAVYPTKRLLTLQISCTLMSASCPLCQHSSERVHGRYGRTVADVPCGGRLVTLALTVRKFVCGTKTCPRRIFTERLPDLVQSYARMTNRLSEVLQALGFATCGELGERFAPQLGMQVSGPTLLRHMRVHSCPAPSSVRILGRDDWCWKKGMTYGTILVDLERRRAIEILPDRTAETAEAWLRTHPEVEIVSRDRGGNYAAAAKKGAPQAQQVADKFHVLKNLRDELKDFLARKQKWLPEAEEASSDGVPRSAQGKGQESTDPSGSQQEGQEKHFRHMPQEARRSARKSPDLSAAEQRSQVSRANRSARYEAVRTLHQQAFSDREIGRRLKLSRVTVRTFIMADAFPAHQPPPIPREHAESLQALHFATLAGGLLERSTDLHRDQRAWIYRIRFLVQALHQRPAEEAPGSRNLGGPDPGCPWRGGGSSCFPSSQTLSQSAYVSDAGFLAVCESAEQAS